MFKRWVAKNEPNGDNGCNGWAGIKPIRGMHHPPYLAEPVGITLRGRDLTDSSGRRTTGSDARVDEG